MNDLNRQSATSRNAVPNEVSGVLETMAAGFSLVLAKPWLLLLPLVIDLVTWLGGQISAQPLVDSMQRLLVEQGGTNGPDAAEEIARIGENMRVNDVMGSLIPSIFSGLPNDTVLATLLGVLVPSITRGVDRSNLYADWEGGILGELVPGSDAAVIGWALGFFFIATMLLALFKAPIALAVRGGETSVGILLRDIAMGWVRIVALGMIILAGLMLMLVPLILAALAVAILGLNLVAVISLAIFVFGSIGALYVYFLLDAMFIYRVGPIRAARMSYSVAKLNFAQAWRFAATSVLITAGLIQVWNLLIENPPGIIVSLVFNAAIGAGISAASMMFFHDRARLPRPVPSTSSTSTFPSSRRF